MANLHKQLPLLLVLPLVGPALLMGLGLGVVRHASPAVVVAVASAVILLPPLALAAPFRGRTVALPLMAALWSMALITVFPVYFPAERDEALAAGVAVFALPLGFDPDPAWATALDAALPALPSGERPAVPATPGEAPRLAIRPAREADPPPLADGDSVVLPYEGSGRTLSVPVDWEQGGREPVETWMLFDTGATLTSLDHETIEALGIKVPRDAPTVNLRTANGATEAQVVLVDRLWIGGLPVDGVTVSVCDACADEHSRGLLGLNVSGRFLVTVDQSRGELVLQPSAQAAERLLDVAPWTEVEATATRWPDGRVEVEVRLHNLAPRTIREARVEIGCEGTWMATLQDVPAGTEQKATVSLPVGAVCEGYTVRLAGARW